VEVEVLVDLFDGPLSRTPLANSSVPSRHVSKVSGVVIAGGISVLCFYAKIGEAVEITSAIPNE
jgi:hypothetical protein